MKSIHYRLAVLLMAQVTLLTAWPMTSMADEPLELIIEDVFTDDSEDMLDILEDDLSQAPEVIDSDDDIILGPIEDFTDLNTATDWMNLDETPVLDEAVDNEAVPNASGTQIGDYSYTFANGLATITGYSGSNTTLTLPDKVIYEGTTYDVTGIGSNVFNGSNITTITVPAKINTLGDSAFANCVNLISVTINGDIKDTSEYRTVFYNTGTSSGGFSVIFGSCVTRVPANLFYTNSSKVDDKYAHVNKVTLSDSVTEIGNSAFCNCYDLASINWGSGLKYIGAYAFCNGISLSTVSLPAKVINLGKQAFSGCSNLSSLTLPASTNTLGDSVFVDCVNLTSVTINGDIKDTSDYHTVFYNTGTSSGGFSVTFGSGVTRVPANLFYTNSSKVDNTYAHVNKVSLPDSITEIGNNAFCNCYDLKDVVYAGSQSAWGLVTIGKNNDPLLSASFIYDQSDAIAVTSVTLNRTSLTLPVGATATLTAKVKPAKATDKTVVWSSSDPDVVTVEDGKIKAIGEGIATVTATSASDSSKNASCEITVPKPPSRVTLNKNKATLVVGAKLTLIAKLKTTDAKTTLTWTSSNKKVANVTSKGVVKALKKGTATITVKTANGKKATCKINVPTAPTKIQFAKKQYSVKKGKKITLKTSLTPAAAKTTLTWSSDNKKIATVTKNGVVKGIRKGTVTITVKTANGKTASVKVTVK